MSLDERAMDELVERKIRVLEDLWRQVRIDKVTVRIPEYARKELSLEKWRLPWLASVFTAGVMDQALVVKKARILFYIDWLGNPDSIPIRLLVRMKNEAVAKVYGRLSSEASRVLGSGATLSSMLGMVHPVRPLLTPIAWAVVSSLVSYAVYGGALHVQGSRLVLAAGLGSGKTTFSIWSLIAGLRAFGVRPETVLNYVREFFVNTVEGFVAAVRVAGEYAVDRDMIAPMVALDDAAVIMSKYMAAPAFASRAERLLARYVTEFTQISREGIGVLLFITSRVTNLARGIRDTVDRVIVGIDGRMGTEVCTIWLELLNTPVVRSRLDDLARGRVYRSLVKADVAGFVTATCHPPLLVPSELYDELQRRKLESRRSILRRILEAGRSAEEEGEGGEEGAGPGGDGEEAREETLSVDELAQLLENGRVKR